MVKYIRSKWRFCWSRKNLFVLLQVLAISGYINELFASVASPVNVWSPYTALPYENWHRAGGSASPYIPCLLTITDESGHSLEFYGWVFERDSIKECRALIWASKPYHPEADAPASLREYLNNEWPDLVVEEEAESAGCLPYFKQFKQYLIHSAEFSILPKGSDTPGDLKPLPENTPLPRPTAINTKFPRMDEVNDVVEYYATTNAEGTPVDPAQFFDCMNNEEDCPVGPFNSSFCPAGTEVEKKYHSFLHTCNSCQEGKYQDYSGVPLGCKNVTACPIPFTEKYNATSQFDNICDCAGTARFIISPYEHIAYSFVYDHDQENVTIAENEQPLPANYMHPFRHLTGNQHPYNSLCILPAGFCETKDSSDQRAYGVYFQFENLQSTCHVVTGETNSSIIPSLAVSSSNTLQSESPVTPSKAMISMLASQAVVKTGSVIPVQATPSGQPMLIVPTVCENCEASCLIGNDPLSIGIVSGISGALLLVFTIGAGVVFYALRSSSDRSSALKGAVTGIAVKATFGAIELTEEMSSAYGSTPHYEHCTPITTPTDAVYESLPEL